jgi:hypothetical protein
MDNKGKWKSFTIREEIDILVQVDAHIGTCVELALHLRLFSGHTIHYFEEP